MIFNNLDNLILVGLGFLLAIAFTTQPWIFTSLILILTFLVLNKPLFKNLNRF
jgi:hypothetical protein